MPPARLRKLEVAVLMRTFARAFGVAPASVRGLGAAAALSRFRAFTAGCMEIALEDSEVAALLRARLGDEAFRLGRSVRLLVPGAGSHAGATARYFYRGIGIGLFGDLPGELRFAPCAFARRYTPEDCWFMSAFDEGFMRGLSGLPEAELRFSSRLTEGAPCCKACFAVRRGSSRSADEPRDAVGDARANRVDCIDEEEDDGRQV